MNGVFFFCRIYSIYSDYSVYRIYSVYRNNRLKLL